MAYAMRRSLQGQAQRRTRGSAPRALFHCVGGLITRVPEEAGQRTPALLLPVAPPV